MNAMATEFKQLFPGEKVKSACRASIIPVTEQKETEKIKYSKVPVANVGTFLVTDKRIAFLVDRRNYYVLMGLIALVGIAMLAMMMGGGWQNAWAALMGVIMFAAMEGFLAFQMKHASMLEFDGGTAQVNAETRKIRVAKKGSVENRYDIIIGGNEPLPKL